MPRHNLLSTEEDMVYLFISKGPLTGAEHVDSILTYIQIEDRQTINYF